MDAKVEYSDNHCHICKFPAGKYTNEKTGVKRNVMLFNCNHGKVCQECLKKGFCIRKAKLSKKERKRLKRQLLGL